MKKLFVLVIFLLIVMFVFCACDSSIRNTTDNNNVQNTQQSREVVQLSKDNYQKYIAIYVRKVDSTYYYDFVGSSLCKFNNAVINFYLSGSDSIPENAKLYSCELNISGCGQSKQTGYASQYGSAYRLIVESVTGTVEILY